MTMTAADESNRYIRRYYSSGKPVDQPPAAEEHQQEQDNYDFSHKIHRDILQKLEELTQRIERLEVSEGLSIAVDTSSLAIPFKKDSGSLIPPYI